MLILFGFRNIIQLEEAGGKGIAPENAENHMIETHKYYMEEEIVQIKNRIVLVLLSFLLVFSFISCINDYNSSSDKEIELVEDVIKNEEVKNEEVDNEEINQINDSIIQFFEGKYFVIYI